MGCLACAGDFLCWIFYSVDYREELWVIMMDERKKAWKKWCDDHRTKEGTVIYGEGKWVVFEDNDFPIFSDGWDAAMDAKCQEEE